jgi:hypothetical protein
MNKTFTDQDTARIFAMYWGNKYRAVNGVPTDDTKVNSRIIEAVEAGHDIKLRLLPLEYITNEDAAEVAKAAGLIQQSFGLRYMIAFGKNMAHYFKNNIHNGYRIEPLDYVNIADKFRELGYAVPYQGIDLFEAGVAIDKTKQPTQ